VGQPVDGLKALMKGSETDGLFGNAGQFQIHCALFFSLFGSLWFMLGVLWAS
jgi:hypothetical protein